MASIIILITGGLLCCLGMEDRTIIELIIAANRKNSEQVCIFISCSVKKNYQEMKNLYGLLIAINEYPNPAHALKGCENDRNHFQKFLEETYSSQYHLHLQTLTNNQATRDNIIKGFNFFDQAKDGDTCLLFYAGHGSRIPAPAEFYHLESDKHLETIVCYDSRQPGGKDLIDKELSYLIWKVAHEKDVHFVAIMDCCHAGSNTRNEVDSVIFERTVETREDKMMLSNFLGYEHYQRSEKGFLTPPRARHVLLAAAQSYETAKEIRGYGLNRGVFSFCLLEALTTAGQPLSYTEVAQRTAIRVKGLIHNQLPTLEADEAEDKELIFLSGEGKKNQSTFFISFDKDKGWVASIGAIHGVSRDLQKHKPAFQLMGINKVIKVTEVQASFSNVSDMNGMNFKQKYEAVLIQEHLPVVNYAFSSDAASKGRSMLLDSYHRKLPESFCIVEDSESADYLIYAEDEKWFLSLRFSKRALFQQVGPFIETQALDFLKKLEKVAKWRRVFELSSPTEAVRSNEFSIDLERITEPGNYTYDAKGTIVDWQKPLLLEYQKNQDSWNLPAFRLKVKNTGHRKLWFSVLYLEDNFAISNELLPDLELAPGEESWLQDRSGQYPTNAIRVWMDEIYRHRQRPTIKEYLKIIVSNEHIQTDALNQQGLPYEGPIEDNRSFGQVPEVKVSGWTTRVIELNIHRPL